MMVDALENPPQNDPINSSFLISRTLKAFSWEKGMEPGAISDFFSSKASNDPKDLIEQAKSIFNGAKEDPKFEFAQQLPSKGDNGKAVANGADQLQRRRPALGCKPARFSSQSQPVPHLDLSLDIDNLKDPDEFFTAFERLESTEKELKKSRGGNMADRIRCQMDIVIRRRRPGILGKEVIYKHHYPPFTGNNETIVQSQGEKSREEIPRSSNGTDGMPSSNGSYLKADQPIESQENETPDEEHWIVTQEKGSIAETESRVNKLLDELIFKCKGIDESEMVSVLQERLQVKSINLDNLSLPDFGVQINDFRELQEKLSRPSKSLSDLQQVTQSKADGKTPIKTRQQAESFRAPLTSPTPSRSPLASMCMLQKHILQIDSVRDPYSMSLDADVSFIEQSCSTHCMDKQTLPHPDSTHPPDINNLNDEGDSVALKIDGKPSSSDRTFHSSVPEVNQSIAGNDSSEKLPIVDSTCPSGPTEENTNRFDDDINIASKGHGNNSHNEVETMLPEVLGNKNLKTSLEAPILGTLDCRGNQIDNLIPTSDTLLLSDGEQLENQSISLENHDKEHEVPSTISSNKQIKEVAPPLEHCDNETLPHKRCKREVRSLRISLAGVGTKLESGVRRSTRIKSRPLEYWRGERFLYGRIHESLPTVIGMKYASPGKGGEEPMLKVKSYVSQKYAVLVEMAALH